MSGLDLVFKWCSLCRERDWCYAHIWPRRQFISISRYASIAVDFHAPQLAPLIIWQTVLPERRCAISSRQVAVRQPLLRNSAGTVGTASWLRRSVRQRPVSTSTLPTTSLPCDTTSGDADHPCRMRSRSALPSGRRHFRSSVPAAVSVQFPHTHTHTHTQFRAFSAHFYTKCAVPCGFVQL